MKTEKSVLPGTITKLSLRKITKAERDLLLKNLKQGTTWNPVPGEVITGSVISFKWHDGEFGKGKNATKTKTNICTLQQDDETKILVWLKAVLQSRFDELEIVPGDYVAIEYLGKLPGKKYHSYNVSKV
jgi:hypothetical protein